MRSLEASQPDLLRALGMSSAMAGKALLGTIPAPRTCSPQELGVPDTQSYGGDDGHDEQDEQHHGQDEEGVPIRAGGEQGSYQCGMVSQPITKQGPKEGLGQVLCARFKHLERGSGSPARSADPAGSSIYEDGQVPADPEGNKRHGGPSLVHGS